MVGDDDCWITVILTVKFISCCAITISSCNIRAFKPNKFHSSRLLKWTVLLVCACNICGSWLSDIVHQLQLVFYPVSFLKYFLMWSLISSLCGIVRRTCSWTSPHFVSADSQTWAACHRHWICSSQFAGNTHQATQQPVPVCRTQWCTLPQLPTQLSASSAPHRPCWAGKMRNQEILHTVGIVCTRW